MASRMKDAIPIEEPPPDEPPLRIVAALAGGRMKCLKVYIYPTKKIRTGQNRKKDSTTQQKDRRTAQEDTLKLLKNGSQPAYVLKLIKPSRA